MALRVAFSPGDLLGINDIEEDEEANRVSLSLSSAIGEYRVNLEFPEPDQPLIRYTTFLTPHQPLLTPFWPRDIIPLGKSGIAKGKVNLSQEGPRSGLLYFTLQKPEEGSVLYMQNLTALNEYCEATDTSLIDTVGGQWPELGFALPPATEEPLEAGKEYVISDAFLLCTTDPITDEFDMARLFLDMLATIYVHLPKPETEYRDWPGIAEKTLDDLDNNSGCWLLADGHSYLNAYIADYDTPPEIMVQLAVLIPLMDYRRRTKHDLTIIDELKAGIKSFYQDKPGTVVRWLPAKHDRLNGEEEHKRPNVMDSWYLHHPLLNLSRLALEFRDKEAKQLFLDSAEYAIKVAHHFKYQWPVFYDINTLDVIKAETEPGKGGEKDVPGTYAHIMLQAWELTKEKRYLDEAKEAARYLKGTGFGLFYQANNTAFTATAMLQLWKITGDKLYLNLSYLALANIMKNVWLWDCNYGHGKHFQNFFAIFPLSNAPYIAVYEEQEVAAGFHAYLTLAEGEEILPSVSLLLAEFIRHLLNRGSYYYPPELPKEMLADKPKTGELNYKLWIPVEDLHDGREKSGEVGQEVYGAGFAFGLVNSHYFEVSGEPFTLYIDYPITSWRKSGRSLSFSVKGDDRMTCRMLLIAKEDQRLPTFSVRGNQQKEIAGRRTANGIEYAVRGNQKISIKWEEIGKKVNGKKVNAAKKSIRTS